MLGQIIIINFFFFFAFFVFTFFVSSVSFTQIDV